MRLAFFSSGLNMGFIWVARGFNMECCKLKLHDRGSLKSFRGDFSKGKVWWFSVFLRQTARKGGLNFS